MHSNKLSLRKQSHNLHSLCMLHVMQPHQLATSHEFSFQQNVSNKDAANKKSKLYHQLTANISGSE